MRGSFFTLRNFTYPQLNWGFNHAYSAPKMPEAPTGPIVVRSSLDPEEKASLRRIFYTMHENPDLSRSMKTIVIDRFVAPDTAAYEQFKRQYAEQRRLAGT